MKSPELLELTASEPLTLEEEYDMQGMCSYPIRITADAWRNPAHLLITQSNGIWIKTVSRPRKTYMMYTWLSIFSQTYTILKAGT
jgi:hypothetical protein